MIGFWMANGVRRTSRMLASKGTGSGTDEAADRWYWSGKRRRGMEGGQVV